MPVVDLTEESPDFADPQLVQPAPELFYATVNSDFVRQNVPPHTISSAGLAIPQRHYPIHVSVTIPQCPFLQSCELSRNISPGPAPEILVQPPPAQAIPTTTSMASQQCSNYPSSLPQHHSALPPPPAHSNSFPYPHQLGMVFNLQKLSKQESNEFLP